ncbi:ABC transporter permease, partial [Streptomyces sp. NPDC006356]
VPFTMVRTDGVLPGEVYGIGVAVTAVAASVTLGTSLATARRMLRTPAVGAVAVAS